MSQKEYNLYLQRFIVGEGVTKLQSGDNLMANDKIQEALVECLKEKMEIETITVAYLTNKAGVGKSTFYRHYKDIYDVYEQLVDRFIERCEKLITKIFFDGVLTLKEAMWIFVKSGPHKDNELFLATDAVLIHHSIEKGNAKVIEMLYEKMHALIVQIAKRVYDDDEAANFGATFILSGNIIPIFSNLHSTGKLRLETVMISLELFEKEVEKWKHHQQM